MSQIILYDNGNQILIDEKDLKLYDPFPDKSKKEKEDEATEESRNNN